MRGLALPGVMCRHLGRVMRGGIVMGSERTFQHSWSTGGLRAPTAKEGV